MPSPRRIIDLIVQQSTLELLSSYGVAAAPEGNPRGRLASSAPTDFAAMTRFSATGFKGVLALSISTPTLVQLKETLRSTTQTDALLDWSRELTNQLMGRIKNKLARYQLDVHTALPTAFSGNALELQFAALPGSELVYVFRTMKADVLVRLRGNFDEACLVFSAASDIAHEGDVILF